MKTSCSYVIFRCLTAIEREGALGQPSSPLPLFLVLRWQTSVRFAYVSRTTWEGGERSVARRRPRPEGSRALWSQRKHSLGPEGLGCCLPLLSSAFNVTERNCGSDRVDRQLLTASGEKRLFHCGAHVCHGGKMQNSVKKRNEENWFSTKCSCIYEHYKFIKMNL